jgi:hypothetical protein
LVPRHWQIGYVTFAEVIQGVTQDSIAPDKMKWWVTDSDAQRLEECVEAADEMRGAFNRYIEGWTPQTGEPLWRLVLDTVAAYNVARASLTALHADGKGKG